MATYAEAEFNPDFLVSKALDGAQLSLEVRLGRSDQRRCGSHRAGPQSRRHARRRHRRG